MGVELFLVPAAALLFRLRGDAIVGSTTAGRLIYAGGLGLLTWALMPLAAPAWLAPATAAGLFLGSLFSWWGDCLDLGTNGGSRLQKTLWMALRGPVFGLPAAPAWWEIEPAAALALALAGLAAPCWYTAGFWWLPAWRPHWAKSANAVGELGLGASLGAALAFAVGRVT